ncbi:MAG: HEPN domain-containing protein [Mariniphaga sp.]|nr:HEPN domain-containing protein [Mariniphaga sp.]
MNNIEDYINYRLKRADEAYDEAIFLVQKKSWNTIVNRLYYACFYAVTALLLKNKIKANTHRGTLNQFSLHFIKTNKIDMEYGTLYSQLSDFRQKGDYGDMFDFKEDQVTPLIEQVSGFLSEIKKHIQM